MPSIWPFLEFSNVEGPHSKKNMWKEIGQVKYLDWFLYVVGPTHMSGSSLILGLTTHVMDQSVSAPFINLHVGDLDVHIQQTMLKS